MSGKLELNLEKERNGHQQGKAVEIKDGIEGEDQGGHLIADVFGGSPELDNLVSQAKDVNFKQYRDIERAWEKALKNSPRRNY